MFDPARFDPPSRDSDRRLRRIRWGGGRFSRLILSAVSGLVVGAVLMPWFVFVRAWFGHEGLVWLGAWAIAGLLAVPAWRCGRFLVARFGWLRLGLGAGALAVLVVLAQELWFAFGWVPFRPLCVGSVIYEIHGRLHPVAVDHVEEWLHAWRDEDGQLLVRPGRRATDPDILLNRISKDGLAIAVERGIPTRNAHWLVTVDCDEIAAVFIDGPYRIERW